MSTLFLVFREPGPAWIPSRPSRQQPLWDEHAAYMDRLFALGYIVMGGPYSDHSRVLIIVEAQDAEEASALFRDDPWTREEILGPSEVVEWTVFLDSRRGVGREVAVTPMVNTLPDPVISRVGTIRVHPSFPSENLAPRDVQVYLPPGYERETSRHYPVLYMHDGQNVFDAASMGKEWQVDETAEALIRAGRIEPRIVVAVSNTEARRDEYTPTSVERKQPDGVISKVGGKAHLYGRFLIEELKPFIDRTYRTRGDAASTSLGGASLGGLVSVWLALEHPRVFGNALAVSPAVGWDDSVLLNEIESLPRVVPVRIWVDIGLREGEEAVTGARLLRDALEKKGWRRGFDLEYLEQEDGQHDEISWGSRLEGMLTFLDQGPKPPR